MRFAAFTPHAMLSLSKHLRPFDYAQGDRMGQSKDRPPEVQAEGRCRP